MLKEKYLFNLRSRFDQVCKTKRDQDDEVSKNKNVRPEKIASLTFSYVRVYNTRPAQGLAYLILS